MIKTFRGLIADGGQDTIILHTNDGSTGYRIVKFEIITQNPTTVSAEAVVKIWKTEQTTIDALINFSNNVLLAAGVWTTNSGALGDPEDMTIIFDREIFNQDIYITYVETANADPCNYYLELEQIKLDLSENTVATLKDIRNIETPA